MPTISRRAFLITGAAAGLSLTLRNLRFPAAPAAVRAAVAPPSYRSFEDIQRRKWRWDRVVRGTHTNANCESSCAWNLYVRQGIVWREEQSAPYAASNAGVPDWNPRGCNKGACWSDLAMGPTRVRYPLKRVGARGEGRWKRISWDEALGAISGAMVDTLARRGGEGVICEMGTNVDYGPHTAAALRFFRQIGAPITDSMGQIGDIPVGGTITLGLPLTDGTSDDWFRSRYLVLWAFNPSATRIPDAHYLNEARYAGARVVCISPDYNQSAIHADLWMGVRPGTDAALALAACHVIVEEKHFKADYLREQTDLPFLVREDTRRFLRESDVLKEGRPDRFALWDEAGDGILWAPGTAGSRKRTLRLPRGARPVLDGARRVRLASGEAVTVRPVFSMLRERLARFTPEAAARITGVSAAVIRRFAREFAAAPSAMILSQFGACKNYHSDLIQRSQILLASLTGNLGKPGGGWRSGAFVALDGLALMAMQDPLDLPHLVWTAIRSKIDPEALVSQFESMYVPSTIFHAVHGGLAEAETAKANGDPALHEGAASYLREAIDRKHFPLAPPRGEAPPEVIVSIFGNVLRHSRMGHRIRDTLFASAKTIVALDMRMSETARHADYFLPTAGWYEKMGIKYIATFVPHVTLGDRAMDPLGESKPEWEIFSMLAERVGVQARRRGVAAARGFRGEPCDLAGLQKRFSDDGRFGAADEEKVLRFILAVSAATRGISLEDLRAQGGAVRIASLGPQGGPAGIYTDYSETEPVVPLRDFTERKRPWPTLTGRQQFYVDHPWFLTLGEELPTHKDPPAAGGDHPFTLTGGHTRWSIHAMWRDHPLMLRLQRGEPVVYLNAQDARRKGIADHDLVRVWNDVSSFEARAKIAGAIRPGQAHIFHAWEPFMFRGGRSHQHLAPSPMKVTQLVGDYGHLKWGYGRYEPNQVDRDTRVDVAKI